MYWFPRGWPCPWGHHPTTSEVVAKMILMGHPVSSCHVPVVRSCFILFHTLISSWIYKTSWNVPFSDSIVPTFLKHAITPYIVRSVNFIFPKEHLTLSHNNIFISTKRRWMSHFLDYIVPKNLFWKQVITPYIVRFSQFYISKKRLLLSHNNTVYCPF